MNRVLLALTFLGVQSLNNAQDQDVFARAVCDHSRFCVSQPENCDPQMIGSCQAFASWRLSTNGTELEIGLYAQSASYVAFGFSDSPSMEGGDVYACTTNNEVLRSRTVQYSNSPVSLKGVSGSSIVAENGLVRCQFSRALALGDGDIDPEFYDLNDSNGYHIIMSWDGGLIGGSITRHSPQNRFWQQERTDFTRVLTVDTTTTLSQETEKASSTETVKSMSPSQETFETASPSLKTAETMSPSQKTAETMSPSQETVEIMSPSQKTAETMSPSQETQLPTSPSQVLYSRSVCDQTRFCTSLPGGCDPQMDNCKAFTSWRLSDDGTHVEFALYGKTSTYVAVGISPTPIMDNTDVYACTMEGVVVRSRNTGYSNSDRPLIGVTNSSVTFSNGVITCQFSRVLSPAGEADPELFDLSSDRFYLLMAWNGALDGNSICRHAGDKRFSGDSFNFTQTLSTASTPEMDTSGCGTSKGCFSRPADCDPERDGSCEVFSSWVANADRSAISIELQASTDTYIAIGFSKSGMMDDSDVYACTSNREVRRSRNGVGRRNTAQELKGVSEESVSLTDGVIRCTFTRTAFLDDDDVLFFDLRPGNKYTILLAWGGSLSNGGDIQVHKDRIFSEDAVDLTEISEFSDDGTGDTDLILRKLHGSLMVLAWLCLVSLGITTARYFKDLPGKVCGKPLWFSIHRACMTAVLLLTIVSFVIIVVAVGGFNTITSGPENIVRSLHAICGSIVTILTIINVIMAVFRPHPGEPRRNLYNWAHWAVGTTAHLMALTTILMGTSNHPEQFVVPLLPSLRSYVFWMVVAFIIFHVVLWLIFTFYQVAQNSQDSPKSYDFALNELESIDVPHITSIEEENQIPPLMMSLYWVYASITVLVCLVIFVIIFL